MTSATLRALALVIDLMPTLVNVELDEDDSDIDKSSLSESCSSGSIVSSDCDENECALGNDRESHNYQTASPEESNSGTSNSVASNRAQVETNNDTAAGSGICLVDPPVAMGDQLSHIEPFGSYFGGDSVQPRQPNRQDPPGWSHMVGQQSELLRNRVANCQPDPPGANAVVHFCDGEKLRGRRCSVKNVQNIKICIGGCILPSTLPEATALEILDVLCPDEINNTTEEHTQQEENKQHEHLHAQQPPNGWILAKVKVLEQFMQLMDMLRVRNKSICMRHTWTDWGHDSDITSPETRRFQLFMTALMSPIIRSVIERHQQETMMDVACTLTIKLPATYHCARQ